MTGSDASATDSIRSWIVVVAAFAGLFGVWGTVFTFTVYAEALGSAFGLSEVQTSTVYSTGVAVTFVGAGVAGLFAARLPIRAVLGAAAVFAGTAAAVYQVVPGYAGALLGFAAVGVSAGTVFVLVLSVVPQWFDEYEGRAMGVTLVGSGLGVQVMPFVWLTLLDTVDFRMAFGSVTAAIALVLTASLTVFSRPPSTGREAGATVDRRWFAALFRRRNAWFAFFGVMLMWSWYYVLSGDAVGVLTDAGVTRPVAAGAFGLVGGVSIVSRVASGGLADRYGYRPVILGALAFATVGIVLLLAAAIRPVMYLSLGAFGIGLGALASLYAPALIHSFDPQNPSAVVGTFQFANAIAGLLTPIAITTLAARTGSYDIPLVVLTVLTALGAGLFWAGTGSDR